MPRVKKSARASTGVASSAGKKPRPESSSSALGFVGKCEVRACAEAGVGLGLFATAEIPEGATVALYAFDLLIRKPRPGEESAEGASAMLVSPYLQREAEAGRVGMQDLEAAFRNPDYDFEVLLDEADVWLAKPFRAGPDADRTCLGAFVNDGTHGVYATRGPNVRQRMTAQQASLLAKLERGEHVDPVRFLPVVRSGELSASGRFFYELISTRRIRPGEQILMFYGASYFNDA